MIHISTGFEHAYNAIMAELRGYINGSECRVNEILRILELLSKESISALFEQLRRNLDTWKNMGSISEDQYERGLNKLEEIKRLVFEEIIEKS